ncbi:tRNA pseudouridine(38-40) synthase TruA [soil metagenome]
MRIALGLEYNGHKFCGWQYQDNLRTVQACLEMAVSAVADHPIRVVCAGRTDTGVHALEQVVHFDTTVHRSSRAWVLGCNRLLPTDICIHWAKEVSDNFHARFSATARQYRYIIYNNPIRPALQHGLVTWFCHSLDEALMQQAANYLVGEHDFASFRAKACQAKTSIRNMQNINLHREQDKIIIDFKANAFLHHMIRNIVGVLLEVGVERQPPEWAKHLLDARDRQLAAATAKPDGLYLVGIEYG